MQVIGNPRLYTFFHVVRREPTDETPWYRGKEPYKAGQWGGFSGIERSIEFIDPPPEVLDAQRLYLEAEYSHSQKTREVRKDWRA